MLRLKKYLQSENRVKLNMSITGVALIIEGLLLAGIIYWTMFR